MTELHFRDTLTEILTADNYHGITTKIPNGCLYDIDYWHIVLCIQFDRFDVISKIKRFPPCQHNALGYVLTAIHCKNLRMTQFFWKIDTSTPVCVIDCERDCMFIKELVTSKVFTSNQICVQFDMFGDYKIYPLIALGMAQNNKEFIAWCYTELKQRQFNLDIAIYRNHIDIVKSYYSHIKAYVKPEHVRYAIMNNNTEMLNYLFTAKQTLFKKRTAYGYAKMCKNEYMMVHILNYEVYDFGTKSDLENEIKFAHDNNYDTLALLLTNILNSLYQGSMPDLETRVKVLLINRNIALNKKINL